MDFEPQDQDIVKLLTKLKNAEAQYPEHMLVTRRQMFVKQMMEIGMGIGTGAEIENAAKHTTGPSVSGATSTLLETALVVAIIVESSAVAYFYRDKLVDFFQTITAEPRVQEVTSQPVVATSVELQGVTPSPVITPTIPSATLSSSPSPAVSTSIAALTPVPGLAEDNNTNSATINNTSGTDQSDSTPAPNISNENGNQGNHYGQTPIPERTKENNGNSDPSSGNNNNPAPQANNTQDNNQPSNGNGNRRP